VVPQLLDASQIVLLIGRATDADRNHGEDTDIEAEFSSEILDDILEPFD
jgi:hypothetical protein